MKTVEKAQFTVNQEKIGGCNSQKVERRYDEEMTCPMTINQQWRHVKHSHRQLSAGVQYRCVKATWEKERMRRRCHQMGFDISPQPAPAGVPASSTFYPLVANLVVTNYYW